MTIMNNRIAVIAIGGNSLIKDKNSQSVEAQHKAAAETTEHIVEIVNQGWSVAVSHGNGPQVGFMLRRSELARDELHEVPLAVCGANTQGAIGFSLQQNLYNQFRAAGISKKVTTIVTQTEVSVHDPAFQKPSKPIGSFMDEAEAMKRQKEDGWVVVEDAGRGWRRVVASPEPMRIVEEDIVKTLIDAGIVTITVGGGGIPVISDEEGNLQGVPAVIDKDLASALLATRVGAELFIISTAVEKVALNFGKPNETWVDSMTIHQAREYLAEGVHFAKGSMAPKIQAVINFLNAGGQRAIITNPQNIARALAGETGTHITW